MALFSQNAVLGFWLEDDGLEGALIQPRRKGWKTVGEARAEGDGLLAADDRRDRLGQAFRATLKKLPRAAGRADIAAVLALPDAHVEEDLLRFAEFPAARQEARALVAHRMARELATSADSLAVSWDAFPPKDGQVTCRVRAMDRTLREDIEAAAAFAGLRLVRIDGWSGFASGAPELADYPAGTAVWSDGARWSLLCWSGDDPAGFCQHGEASDVPKMVADVVRLGQSYAEARGTPDMPLVADIPETLHAPLNAAARAAGLKVYLFSAGDARSAQVAAWA